MSITTRLRRFLNTPATGHAVLDLSQFHQKKKSKNFQEMLMVFNHFSVMFFLDLQLFEIKLPSCASFGHLASTVIAFPRPGVT